MLSEQNHIKFYDSKDASRLMGPQGCTLGGPSPSLTSQAPASSIVQRGQGGRGMAPQEDSTPPTVCFAVFHRGQKIRMGVMHAGHVCVPSAAAGTRSGPALWARLPLLSVTWRGASFPRVCRVTADAQ